MGVYAKIGIRVPSVNYISFEMHNFESFIDRTYGVYLMARLIVEVMNA